jgi:EpsI family protein
MLDAIRVNDAPLSVNRAVIQRGEIRHLVYYWFKQRDRVITNEYMVKWYLFWDALTRNRTDGALVRLTTLVPPNETMESADSRLTALLQEVQPMLPAYIPD